NSRLTFTLDCVCKIQEYRKACSTYTTTFVAHQFGVTGSHVAWYQVTKSRVLTLQEVIAVFFFDVVNCDLSFAKTLCCLNSFRNPHTAIVTKRLRHQRQLRLVIAGNRDTGRVNLCKARVSE